MSAVRSCLTSGKILNSGSSEAGLLDEADDIGFLLSISDQTETEIVAELRFRADPANPVAAACSGSIARTTICASLWTAAAAAVAVKSSPIPATAKSAPASMGTAAGPGRSTSTIPTARTG